MKTSDVSRNQPVQQNPQQGKAEAKKASKEFKEVLDRSGAKKQPAGAKYTGETKKKAFSPLNQDKNAGLGKTHAHTGEHKHIDTKSDRQEVGKDDHEEVGEFEVGEGKLKKSSLDSEEVKAQPNTMPGAGQTAVQGSSKPEVIEAPRGLNIEHLQSIVQKVHVGVNEMGKPEMHFQIQTHNLGAMNLKVSADGDKIKLDIATEDINAQKVMEEHLNELSGLLRDKGLTLAQTNFTTRDQDQNEKQQQQQEQAWEGPMYSDLPTGRPKKGFNL